MPQAKPDAAVSLLSACAAHANSNFSVAASEHVLQPAVGQVREAELERVDARPAAPGRRSHDSRANVLAVDASARYEPCRSGEFVREEPRPPMRRFVGRLERRLAGVVVGKIPDGELARRRRARPALR